jgi:hypothetical protein
MFIYNRKKSKIKKGLLQGLIRKELLLTKGTRERISGFSFPIGAPILSLVRKFPIIFTFLQLSMKGHS